MAEPLKCSVVSIYWQKKPGDEWIYLGELDLLPTVHIENAGGEIVGLTPDNPLMKNWLRLSEIGSCYFCGLLLL